MTDVIAKELPVLNVQKTIFDLRFPVAASMIYKSADLAELWAADFSDLRVELPRYVLTDKERSRVLAFSLQNVALDVEGEQDFGQFVNDIERLAENIKSKVNPVRVERLGFRQFYLIAGTSAKVARENISNSFFAGSGLWSQYPDRDALQDLMITLIIGPDEKNQSRINFGPYIPTVNRQMFTYQDNPNLTKVEDGYIFDCDHSELDLSKVTLNKPNLRNWLTNAKEITDNRVASLYATIQNKGM